jgi:predicted RNA-binding protein YlqC (UPF0109 family)
MKPESEHEGNSSLAMFKQLLEQITKAVVNKPERVNVRAQMQSNGKKALFITVDKEDLGKIIGKNGQTIKSIRMLVNALNPGPQDITVDVST